LFENQVCGELGGLEYRAWQERNTTAVVGIYSFHLTGVANG
jgi:hypothetical protein